ncbi:MAG: 30S ribosomal protein S4 [DPANN group archaeon]|nr:30S ribosomal protein S4 [DPANN group archaeon]
MGDPRKARKKYKTPHHPWEKERIEAESVLKQDYGLSNKQEIQKMTSVLRNLKAQAKRYIAARTVQAEKEKEQLLQRVRRLGLLDSSATLDDILGLTIEAIMERRLQTLVFRKGLSRTIKQARQMITHLHITVKDRKISAPGALLTKEEELSIAFHETSNFNDIDHPERPKQEKQEKTVVEEA